LAGILSLPFFFCYTSPLAHSKKEGHPFTNSSLLSLTFTHWHIFIFFA
jgi:hypothetical protein